MSGQTSRQIDQPSPVADLALSVVAPCFNEEACLPEFHRRVAIACRAAVGDSFEIVLIDDGSKDRTWPTIVALGEDDPRVVGVSLSRNHGHQLALSAGLTICTGQRILIIDADLQDPPELLSSMMQRMDRGVDVVYGQRRGRRGETWIKKSSAALFYRILDRMVDVPIPLDTGDFRLISRRALDQLNAMPERFRFIRGMVSWIGFAQEPLLYERDPRYAGSTGYGVRQMVGFALNALTSFSIRPLRIASLLGALFGIFGLFLMAWVVISRFVGAEVEAGWTSLMLAILILGSAQLFVIGVLGEYLGRLYMEAKQRPLFIIDRIVRQQADTAATLQSDPQPRSAPLGRVGQP